MLLQILALCNLYNAVYTAQISRGKMKADFESYNDVANLLHHIHTTLPHVSAYGPTKTEMGTLQLEIGYGHARA